MLEVESAAHYEQDTGAQLGSRLLTSKYSPSTQQEHNTKRLQYTLLVYF